MLEGVRSKYINYILSFPKAGESRTEEVGEQDLVSVSNSVTSKDLCDNLSDCLADQKMVSEEHAQGRFWTLSMLQQAQGPKKTGRNFPYLK